jgi:hypothetical protein
VRVRTSNDTTGSDPRRPPAVGAPVATAISDIRRGPTSVRP